MQKKDIFYDSILKTKHYAFGIFQFLRPIQILSLSLLNTKYYILTAPILMANQNTPKKQFTKIKPSLKKKQADSLLQTINIDVTVEHFPINKWRITPNQLSSYKQITKLPISNAYLQRKLDSKCYIFYQNPTTIIYINRSLIDPSLNYNKSAAQLNDLYEDIYDEDVSRIDFSCQQALLQRQKQLLSKIQLKKEQNNIMQQINYVEQLCKLQSIKRIGVILCFGGSFSIGVFEHNRCICHKSDKKYVCRKKAGERQLNKDKQGKGIKSMGSQIRRDQEKKHIINVGSILQEYKELLSQCEIILLQAPGLNRLVVVNQKENMEGVENKLRSLCMTAKKANFTQIENIFQEIYQVHIVKK